MPIPRNELRAARIEVLLHKVGIELEPWQRRALEDLLKDRRRD